MLSSLISSMWLIGWGMGPACWQQVEGSPSHPAQQPGSSPDPRRDVKTCNRATIKWKTQISLICHTHTDFPHLPHTHTHTRTHTHTHTRTRSSEGPYRPLSGVECTLGSPHTMQEAEPSPKSPWVVNTPQWEQGQSSPVGTPGAQHWEHGASSRHLPGSCPPHLQLNVDLCVSVNKPPKAGKSPKGALACTQGQSQRLLHGQQEHTQGSGQCTASMLYLSGGATSALHWVLLCSHQAKFKIQAWRDRAAPKYHYHILEQSSGMFMIVQNSSNHKVWHWIKNTRRVKKQENMKQNEEESNPSNWPRNHRWWIW